MSFHIWLPFAMAWLATTLSPGPAVLLVMRNAMRYGHHAIAGTVAGNLCAQLIGITIVVAGSGKLLNATPPLFSTIRIAGAAWLILIGGHQFLVGKSRHCSLASPGGEPESLVGIFREAFIVSGTNPNALIFLLAAVPQFVQRNEPLVGQFAVMYLTAASTIIVVHTTYACTAYVVHKRFAAHHDLGFLMRCSGALFIWLGVRMMISA